MDPLNLLRELYGEEPIRKILSSGFDAADKIAAATPESLSFFSGIQEVLARQIIDTAEEALGKPVGSEPAPAAAVGVERAVRPRELPRHAAPKKSETQRSKPPRVEPLDERPLLDSGGVLRTVAREPNPSEFMEEAELMAEVGLTDAEAGFLEGLSPWSDPARRERISPVPLETEPAATLPEVRSEPLEFAPISDWSPEVDPDPVPRLVRAGELSPEPTTATAATPEVGMPPTATAAKPEVGMPTMATAAEPEVGVTPDPKAIVIEEPKSVEPPRTEEAVRPSFWRFGRRTP